MKDYIQILQELLRQQVPYDEAVKTARRLCGMDQE